MTVATETGQENTGAGGQQTAEQSATGQPATGENQQPGGQGGEKGEQKPEGGAKPEAVDYDTFEFKHPDGGELDQTALASFRELAKARSLKPEDAQALVDLYAKQQTQRLEQFVQTQAAWVADIKADKEFGGGNFEESSRLAKAAVEHIGDPAFKDFLNTSGFGNHPMFFKAFAKLGKFVAPDKPLAGGRTPSGEVSTADAFYPTMKK